MRLMWVRAERSERDDSNLWGNRGLRRYGTVRYDGNQLMTCRYTSSAAVTNRFGKVVVRDCVWWRLLLWWRESQS